MISIRNARQHNLKGLDLDLPRGAMTVITGVSGSGKSSLAFDTLYAEGQRRYVESVSTYARQFLDRMPRPDVDSIAGLQPAVAIQQSNRARSARSTVGTSTEISDYLRLLFARVGKTHCPRCGRVIGADSPGSIADEARAWPDGVEVRVFAPFALPPRLPWKDVVPGLVANGYLRIGVPGKKADAPWTLVDLEPLPKLARGASTVYVLLDRFRWRPDLKPRLVEALEAAFARGEGRLHLGLGEALAPTPRSDRRECPVDGLQFPDPTPNLFSFNSPLGVCPTCKGFGDVLEFDPALVVPDPRKTLAEGAIDPWAGSWRAHFSKRLADLSKKEGVPLNVPFSRLSAAQRALILDGGKGFRGVMPFLERLKEKSYKAANRFIVKRYQRAARCPSCGGARLRPEALAVRVGDKNIAAWSALTLGELATWLPEVVLGLSPMEREIAATITAELVSRLSYLVRVDLGYLTLDRLARTLSGGEAQRIELANALGANLVDTLYVLDEPTVGLHPRDSERLADVLQDLARRGNTLVVVEHEPLLIERADWVVDLGPGAGVLGGELLWSGPGAEMRKPGGPVTPTALYLRGEERVRRTRAAGDAPHEITIEDPRAHNLKGGTIRFPLGRLSCLTGVSGSGKSTLLEEILYPSAHNEFEAAKLPVGPVGRVTGLARLARVALVDQSPIGRSPRSNPLTYVKGFDALRELYARVPEAVARGYRAGTFSFNVPGGRCENCQGDGMVAVEMYFLADILLPCDVCGGARYKPEVLEVRYRGLNVRQALDLTVEEARAHFAAAPALVEKLLVLSDVGLGYLTLGQPAPTLSGGEAQRLKIARELAMPAGAPALYLLDEPTVGLALADVARLLAVLDRLVARGHTVIVVEHNLDFVRNADWIVDLGPGGGEGGGHVVAQGPPEAIAHVAESWTGRFLVRDPRGDLSAGLVPS